MPIELRRNGMTTITIKQRECHFIIDRYRDGVEYCYVASEKTFWNYCCIPKEEFYRLLNEK